MSGLLKRGYIALIRPVRSSSFFVSSPIYLRFFKFKRDYSYYSQMGYSKLNSHYFQNSSFRLCNVSGHMTDLLEIHSPNPKLHVLFIPGNPGVVNFYKDFLESLYELLEGSASITAIGHISQTTKDWEHGRLFSMEEQINHKVEFISQELQNSNVPLILVGHSVGSHISIEVFKRTTHKVIYVVGLYPFLALNAESSKQTAIKKLVESPAMRLFCSLFVGLLGLAPNFSRFVMKKTIGTIWSEAALDAGCSHLLKYHTLRNVLFMAMTEFQTFSEAPDWKFLRGNQNEIAFLFGIDDHWGPLSLFEEISKQVPNVELSIEKEGHDHAFSCTIAGSTWAAHHVAALIQKRSSTL